MRQVVAALLVEIVRHIISYSHLHNTLLHLSSVLLFWLVVKTLYKVFCGYLSVFTGSYIIV